LPSSGLGDRLLLVTAAVLFSTGGVAVKAASLTGWQMASCRSGVAAVALLAALPETRRGWNWRIVPVAACLGLFCGLAFRQARSIRASMVTHALAVTAWRLFFT